MNPKVEQAVADEAGARIGRPLWADSLGPVRAANRAWVLERHSPEVARTALLTAASAAFDGPGGRSVATPPAAWLDTLGPSFTAWA